MTTGFYRDTWAEINLDAIDENIKNMKKHIGTEQSLIAVVKANAYGHGDIQVARTALEAGAAMLAVAFLDEAISLREAGVISPILVLGAIRPKDVQIAIQYNVIATAISLQWLKEAAGHIREGKLNYHLKLDTGMGRLGVRDKEEVNDVIQFNSKQKNLVLSGAFTHFATADEINTDYFDEQYKKLLNLIEAFDLDKMIIHCGNSATGLRFPEKLFNSVRFGISMYGLSPSNEIKPELPFPLKEAFSLHTKLVHVKTIHAQEKVSYGATYSASDEEWIGTVPVGYADGWIRRLRDSDVLVNGKRVPIVGRICMDQFMVRLPENIKVGTVVTLIGHQEQEFISIDEVAERLDTINYEVPCTITSRVPRVYLKKNKIIEVENSLLPHKIRMK
ncbi:alanine racemase [Metabacillus arenae]|uniref:Alanine racemase n=1 Tax=Metabacillus arenae TaxID=2771434 RepID=A0A926NI74_9BACI|nr:alanine racemase [Metabacillus arenae]MBD1382149.1 alanine racemase [Metabacillus arenae]